MQIQPVHTVMSQHYATTSFTIVQTNIKPVSDVIFFCWKGTSAEVLLSKTVGASTFVRMQPHRSFQRKHAAFAAGKRVFVAGNFFNLETTMQLVSVVKHLTIWFYSIRHVEAAQRQFPGLFSRKRIRVEFFDAVAHFESFAKKSFSDRNETRVNVLRRLIRHSTPAVEEEDDFLFRGLMLFAEKNKLSHDDVILRFFSDSDVGRSTTLPTIEHLMRRGRNQCSVFDHVAKQIVDTSYITFQTLCGASVCMVAYTGMLERQITKLAVTKADIGIAVGVNLRNNHTKVVFHSRTKNLSCLHSYPWNGMGQEDYKIVYFHGCMYMPDLIHLILHMDTRVPSYAEPSVLITKA